MATSTSDALKTLLVNFKLKFILMVVVILSLTVVSGCSDEKYYITDSQGRAIILHGVNVGNDAKSDPLRVGSINRETVFRFSKDWGFNAVRMLIFWDAIEPEKDVFDHAYLDRVEERLDWYEEAGILVILDMHQDVYSNVFCCDGAPEWAVRDDDLSFEIQDIWWSNYNQPAVKRAFDNFWDSEGPHSDLQEHYTLAWIEVVDRFKNHPAVIGYDLMNEPYEGSANSMVFETTSLKDFYNRLISRIRQVDQDSWIFFEPIGLFVAMGMPSYLPALTDTRRGEPRLAYIPHLYEPTLTLGLPYFGATTSIVSWLTNRSFELQRHKCPIFIGEFGEDETKAGFNQYLNDLFSKIDYKLSGWFLWSYDPGSWGLTDGNGNENEKLDELVYTYPQRIAGNPEDIRYQRDSRVLTVKYRNNDAISGPTEIYIPEKRMYPEGFDVWLSDPEGTWEWDPERETLSVSIPTSPGNNKIHEIRIAPVSG